MGTKTSDFGVGKRESHDSSQFYARFGDFKPSKDTEITVLPKDELNQIYVQSSEDMSQLPDSSVALMVTSPPYHVGKEYDSDGSFDEYLDMLTNVVEETERVLQPGGRMAINIAGLGRSPYIPLSTYVDAIAIELGFLPRGQIVWVKGKGASGSCAWGSFQSPSNPTLRDLHEYVLVYSKGRFDRVVKGEATISKEDFMASTLSVWEMKPESAKKVGHPAPYPVELPRRLIELYTYKDEIVLDPFMGSGTTALAAIQTGRHYIGYETSQDYVDLAEKRIGGVLL